MLSTVSAAAALWQLTAWLCAHLWRVDWVIRRLCDELTGDELTVWRDDRVTWLCDAVSLKADRTTAHDRSPGTMTARSVRSCCMTAQWRNNRACKACSAVARGPRAVGAQNLPDAVFKKFFGEEGALLEYLHAGPLQPCYATVTANNRRVAPSILNVSIVLISPLKCMGI